MSRVIPYSTIENGSVPRTSDFDYAREVFSEESRLAIGESTIRSAVIFGSVARGSAGPRSDMDILISATNSNGGRQAGRNIVQSVISETKGRVPINAIVKPSEALATGNHEIDRHIGRHLLTGSIIVIGELPKIEFRPASPKATMISFLNQKIRKLENAHSSNTLEDVLDGESLSRMLDLPIAVGRKSVQVFSEINPNQADLTQDSANRDLVAEQAMELFKYLGTQEGFDLLSSLDAEYAELLDKAIANRSTEYEYNQALLEIFKSMPLAIDWLYKIKGKVLGTRFS